MNAVSSIALSSMNLASERLARSAQNVANVDTPGYDAEQVVARDQAGGGVTGAAEATSSPQPTYERGRDEVLGSNTDMISETVEQLGASQQFKASIALLKTDQDMMQSLLDLKA